MQWSQCIVLQVAHHPLSFPQTPPSDPSALKPTATLISTIEDAHGVADLNSLAFGPVDLSGRQSGLDMDAFPDVMQSEGQQSRFKEVHDDDDDEAMAIDRSPTHNNINSWNHLLASTGDDGSLKVWSVRV